MGVKNIALSGAATDVLYALFTRGALASGDLPSKSGASELREAGLAETRPVAANHRTDEHFTYLTSGGQRYAIQHLVKTDFGRELGRYANGGYVDVCAKQIAGSVSPAQFGVIPFPSRKIGITLSGLEQWKDGVVSGADVRVDILQKGKCIHSEVFSGKASHQFTREITVTASFDEIVTVHNRPDLPLLKVTAAFIQ